MLLIHLADRESLAAAIRIPGHPRPPDWLFWRQYRRRRALLAATDRPEAVGAVVSRGGCPDLAGPVLTRVRTPTLLIVGGDDFQVIELNRTAFEKLRGEKRFVIVPGATHLFEEPGALDEVAVLARDWFRRYLLPGESRAAEPETD